MDNDGHDAPLYRGPQNPDNDILALMLKSGHHEHIRILHAYMQVRFYCVQCNVRGKTILTHYKCSMLCRRCLTADCPSKSPESSDEGCTESCEDCGVFFKNRDCMRPHKQAAANPIDNARTKS